MAAPRGRSGRFIPKASVGGVTIVAPGTMGGTVRIDDLYEVAKLIEDMGTAAMVALGQAMHDEAEKIIEDAKDNYVPEESGDLAATGRVSELLVATNFTQVEFGFGQPGMPRAVAIHEHQTAGGSPYDPKSWRAKLARGERIQFRKGGPKYLERPLMAAIGSGMGKRIVARARWYMGWK